MRAVLIVTPNNPPDSEDVSAVESLDEIRALAPDTEAILVRKLDDTKLRALSQLRHLRILYTDGNCAVTDAALPVLASMSALETLDLEWDSMITDAGLKHLAKASQLRWLDLGFCENLTPSGLTWLRNALPECEIEPGAV